MTAVTSDPAVDEAPEPSNDATEQVGAEEPVDPTVQAEVDALALVPTQKTFTAEQLALLEARGMPIEEKGINPAMLQGFLLLCLTRGVNPFIGEATLMPTPEGWAAILQIDGYRTIAERTGEYEGRTKPEWCDADSNWYDAWPKQLGRPFGARVGVYRRGHREADYAVVYTHEVEVFKRVPRPGAPGFYDEVLTERWANGGTVLFLTQKCAEAAAFRIAFPRELDGFYTKEEMERANRLRQENEARRAADQARAERRRAYEEARAAEDPPTRVQPADPAEPPIEGVVVRHGGQPVSVKETMAAARDLISKAHAETPAPPVGVEEEVPADSEHEAPRADLPAPTAAVEVPADLPLSEEQRADCLRAELTEQSAVLGVKVETMTARFAPIYEGDPLSTWDSNVLLSVVAFFRPRVAKRLDALGRWEEAAAYREAGTDYVDRLDVLFGRSVEPVGEES